MKTNFHMKRWAPGLALKKKPKVIRKWPILENIAKSTRLVQKGKELYGAGWWPHAELDHTHGVAMEPPCWALHFCQAPTNLWWHQFPSSFISHAFNSYKLPVPQDLGPFSVTQYTAPDIWWLPVGVLHQFFGISVQHEE